MWYSQGNWKTAWAFGIGLLPVFWTCLQSCTDLIPSIRKTRRITYIVPWFFDAESWSVCTKLKEQSRLSCRDALYSLDVFAVQTRAIPRCLCSFYFQRVFATVALCCTALGEEPVARQCWAPESMYLDTPPFAKFQALQGAMGRRWSARFEENHWLVGILLRPLDTSLELLFAGSKLSVSMAPTLCAANDGSADRLQLAMSATPWVEWPLISLWRKSWRPGRWCRLHHTAWFIVLLLSLVACSGGPETFLPYLGFY